MEVIYKDKQIIVCIKPVNTLSEGEGESCLPTMLSRLLAEQGESNTDVFPVHRLDKETVGVTVYARTSAAAASLSQSITQGKMSKSYLAVVHGAPDPVEATLDDLLFYDRARGKSFIVDRMRKGVKTASLTYGTLGSAEGLSLLEVALHTGRTHQIRAQLSHIGHPLAGDRRYGAPKSEVATVALLAHTLSFPHPQSGKSMSFSVPIPTTHPWCLFA